MSSFRKYASLLRHTPLHPQWLFGRRRVPKGLGSARGIVLDIGAADRWIVAHLSTQAWYVALDYPATNNEFYSGKPDVFGDASLLPFSDSSVDNVVCLEVIEHLPDPAGALREIMRVLRPGGQAWVSVPFAYPIHNAPYDFQRYTEHGLRREAEQAGLDVLELRRSNHALRAAAILMCLAIAGGLENAHAALKPLLLPFALLGIAMTNATAWGVSLLWPDWNNLSTGYSLVLRKAWR